MTIRAPDLRPPRLAGPRRPGDQALSRSLSRIAARRFLRTGRQLPPRVEAADLHPPALNTHRKRSVERQRAGDFDVAGENGAVGAVRTSCVVSDVDGALLSSPRNARLARLPGPAAWVMPAPAKTAAALSKKAVLRMDII